MYEFFTIAFALQKKYAFYSNTCLMVTSLLSIFIFLEDHYICFVDTLCIDFDICSSTTRPLHQLSECVCITFLSSCDEIPPNNATNIVQWTDSGKRSFVICF